MTAKTRVLLLPFLALGFFVAAIAVFYFRISCAVDGRESLGDKSEWSILQSLEAAHRDSPISALEFSEREGYHILCVPGIANSKRVWIMLDPRNPPFYKQLPHHSYSLSREQYGQITYSTRHIYSRRVSFITRSMKRRDASNQTIQPTAGRSDTSLHFMKTHPLQATLALASGG